MSCYIISNISSHISYRIVSYHILYHIIPYYITSYIKSNHIISYYIVLYFIISVYYITNLYTHAKWQYISWADVELHSFLTPGLEGAECHLKTRSGYPGNQLGWPQSRSESFEKKIVFSLLVFEPQTVLPVTKSVYWLHYSGSRIPLYCILRNVKKVRAVLSGQGHYTFGYDRNVSLWHTLYSTKLKLQWGPLCLRDASDSVRHQRVSSCPKHVQLSKGMSSSCNMNTDRPRNSVMLRGGSVVLFCL